MIQICMKSEARLGLTIEHDRLGKAVEIGEDGCVMDPTAAKLGAERGRKVRRDFEAQERVGNVGLSRVGMNRKHRGLAGDARREICGLELACFFNIKWIGFRLNIDVLLKALGVDGSLRMRVFLKRKKQGDERVTRPIKNPNRQPMVAGQNHPVPKIGIPRLQSRTLQAKSLEPILFYTCDAPRRSLPQTGNSANRGQ